MLIFLLICILLCMFKPVRSLIGCAFRVIAAAWAYGHYLAPHDPSPQPTAVIEPPAAVIAFVQLPEQPL
ncbi:MAG: hypothetical protein WAO08_25830 [Hyphomicrobiaceae bacterium]